MDRTDILLLSMIFLWVSCHPSKSVIADHKEEEGSVLLEMDHLGRLYLVGSQGELFKIQDGDTIAIFQNKKAGFPTSIDVYNPQKVFVFYKDFGGCMVLDQSLTSTRTMYISDMGLNRTAAVAPSSDGYLWVLDEMDNRIKKMDDRGVILIQSDPLYYFVSPAIKVTKMMEREGMIWLIDPAEGLVRFDIFGQFIEAIPLHAKWCTLLNGVVIYWEDDRVFSWQPGRGLPRVVASKVEDVETLVLIVDQWLNDMNP